MCLALAMWNGADPIVKERMFGLSNTDGNHGEDVKEYWFYLDSTPTHSYLKCLYKYPQRPFPYDDLVTTNGARGRQDFEYELLDTGAFDEDRYFDVVVEYAKAGPDDLLMLVTVHNRGPEPATLHLLPTLWFRNTWSWGDPVARPSLAADGAGARASHPELGEWRLHAEERRSCCSARTRRTTSGSPARPTPGRTPRTRSTTSSSGGNADAVNPDRTGTKCAAHHVLEIPAGDSAEIRLRLTAAERPHTAARSGPTSIACWPPGARTPTASTPRSSRRRSTPTARA